MILGSGCLFGTLSGNAREVLHKFTVDLPKKHGVLSGLYCLPPAINERTIVTPQDVVVSLRCVLRACVSRSGTTMSVRSLKRPSGYSLRMTRLLLLRVILRLSLIVHCCDLLCPRDTLLTLGYCCGPYHCWLGRFQD